MATARGRTGRAAASALAAAVVTVFVLLVLGLATLVLLDDGWTRAIWGTVGGLLLWQLLPRPARPGPRVVPVTAGDAPALQGLVGEVAQATGSRPPHSVGVDTTYSTTLVPVGYLGRTMLVIGLPQWTSLDDDERLAVLAHELACAEAVRGPAGILFRIADDLLTRAVLLLSPASTVQPHETTREQYDSGLGALGAGDELAGDRFRREVAANVGSAGLTVVAAPARAVQRALRAAGDPVTAAACLAADRRAAALVGSAPVVGLLLSTLEVPRGSVAAEVAARTRLDPFRAITDSARPGAQELDRRLSAAAASRVRVDSAHPHAPTAARIEALNRGEVVVTRGVARSSVQAADRDLGTYRQRLAKRFAEELVHGRP